MKNEFNAHASLYQKFNGSALDLVKFMQGEASQGQQGIQESEWARWLCYYLTIKTPPNVEFSQVLNEYHSQVYAKFEKPTHTYSLIYFLIKLYATRQAAQQQSLIDTYLSNFNRVKPTTKHSVQDHRLQFLTTLVLYYL